MNGRPILFSEPMIRALLEGRKTQTRRAVKPEPHEVDCGERLSDGSGSRWTELHWKGSQIQPSACPYGKPGDLLWVRESFATAASLECDKTRSWWKADVTGYAYAADDEVAAIEEFHPRWTPSIHMPRKASRLTLRITNVRVQRLQDISEADCCAEGCGSPITRDCKQPKFMALWESINGPDSWDANPWVWALTFEVIKTNVDEVLKVRS